LPPAGDAAARVDNGGGRFSIAVVAPDVTDGIKWHPAFNYAGLMISWRVMDAIFPSIQLLAVNLLYPGYGYH
jgi:hypothetical protein